MSYLLGSAAIVGLPLGLTVLLVIVGHIAGNAVGNEGFPVVVIVLGFVFLFGLFFSIPVFLIVGGHCCRIAKANSQSSIGIGRRFAFRGHGDLHRE